MGSTGDRAPILAADHNHTGTGGSTRTIGPYALRPGKSAALARVLDGGEKRVAIGVEDQARDLAPGTALKNCFT